MNEEQLLEMSGTVEEIVFRNEKNGYTILELNNGEELVTVVGSLPWVSVGELLRVMGVWTKHPTFGSQFKAEAFERYKPETAAAMLKYLSSGAVKGNRAVPFLAGLLLWLASQILAGVGL